MDNKKMIKHALPNAVILSIVYKKLLPIFIFILCTTGCYTILSPLSEYMPPEENQSINEVDGSTIVTNKYINHHNYSNCTGYENSCSHRYWRYNSWTDTYYYDPYYYNSSYYNHHHNDNYWWYSNNYWNNDNYSDNNSFMPPKKTKRNRSYSRNASDSINASTSQENTQTNNSYSENSNNSVNASPSQENTQSNANNDKPKTSNNKRRRKHNRKPL